MAFDPQVHVVDESLRQQAQVVLDQLQAHGISVNPTSRFARYAKALAGPAWDTSPVIGPEDPDIDVARWGVQEIQAMRFILEYPPPENHRSVWLALLREACKDDAVLDPLDPRIARGRNAQHHLFCGGVAIKANVFSGFCEPDLRVTFEGQAWGIACKRLKSPLQFRDQLTGARDQIVGQQIPGVIAVDLTEALNPGNEHLLTPPADDVIATKTIAAVQGFIANHDIESWLSTTWVRGLVCIYWQRLQVAADKMGINTTSLFVPCCWRHETRRAEFGRFQEAWSRGFPTTAESPVTPSLHTMLDARAAFTPQRLANRHLRTSGTQR